MSNPLFEMIEKAEIQKDIAEIDTILSGYDDKRIDTTDGFQHSKWLSFMSERLRIAGELLSKDGIMAISIGYQEVNNLMLLCQELFSNRNIVCVTVQTSSGNAVQNGFT